MESDERAIAYQPALDGVRALAVAAVLLFHAEVPGFSGGYLGVSVFFTLSGYLITSLLLAEHASTGHDQLRPASTPAASGACCPASLACLPPIVVVCRLTDVFDGVADLRRQVLGALLQVSNWVFLAGEGSYQQLFQQTRRRPFAGRALLVAVDRGAVLLGVAADDGVPALAAGAHAPRPHGGARIAHAVLRCSRRPLIADVWGPDAAYWATPARLERDPGRGAAGGRARTVAPSAAAWLLAGAAGTGRRSASAWSSCSRPPSGPAYEGWLPAVAVGSGALVLGLQADSPVRAGAVDAAAGVAGRDLVRRVPVPLADLRDRRRRDGRGSTAGSSSCVQLAVTLAIAEVSYTLLEQPIRRYRGPEPATDVGRRRAMATVAVAVVDVGRRAGRARRVLAGRRRDRRPRPRSSVDERRVEPLAPAIETRHRRRRPRRPRSRLRRRRPRPRSPSRHRRRRADNSRRDDVDHDDHDRAAACRRSRDRCGSWSPATRRREATGAGLIAWAAAHPELAQVEVVDARLRVPDGWRAPRGGWQAVSPPMRPLARTTSCPAGSPSASRTW